MATIFWVVLMSISVFFMGWSVRGIHEGRKPTLTQGGNSYHITYPACPDSSVEAEIADLLGF